ncbi:hypothetical protein [Agromyces neolithicus]|uniref:Uncharacterized protein n=1 Tax=Agromyces neolithicus TaxID=269420 RepID=A0ABN2M203_9MICO
MIDSQALNRAIEIFGGQLTERDAKIDSFRVDDGWDYPRSTAMTSR